MIKERDHIYDQVAPKSVDIAQQLITLFMSVHDRERVDMLMASMPRHYMADVGVLSLAAQHVGLVDGGLLKRTDGNYWNATLLSFQRELPKRHNPENNLLRAMMLVNATVGNDHEAYVNPADLVDSTRLASSTLHLGIRDYEESVRPDHKYQIYAMFNGLNRRNVLHRVPSPFGKISSGYRLNPTVQEVFGAGLLYMGPNDARRAAQFQARKLQVFTGPRESVPVSNKSNILYPPPDNLTRPYTSAPTHQVYSSLP